MSLNKEASAQTLAGCSNTDYRYFNYLDETNGYSVRAFSFQTDDARSVYSVG